MGQRSLDEPAGGRHDAAEHPHQQRGPGDGLEERVGEDERYRYQVEEGSSGLETRLTRARSRRAWRMLRAIQYVLLLGVLVANVLPLAWIFATAFKPDTEIARYPPTILPHSPTLANFRNLFTISDFGAYLGNSLIVSAVTTGPTVP